MLTPLPTPSPEAAQPSARLVEFIRRDIAAQGGWISFARYMKLALYASGLGYYTAGAHKFGEAGDFITAPELSPLFGRTVARQVVEIMAHLSLYASGLGYYTAGAHKFGEAGDFITAPELSPLFGRTVARQVVEIMAHS